MLKSVKSSAEEKFAAIQKKDKKALNEQEPARQERATHGAGLRALRLAKDAADKEATEKTAAKKKKPSRLPKGHRQM